MDNNKFDIRNENGKKVYRKPVFENEDGMTFSEEIWKEFNGDSWCFGCTNCNCN